jgi:hypothetical protein
VNDNGIHRAICKNVLDGAGLESQSPGKGLKHSVLVGGPLKLDIVAPSQRANPTGSVRMTDTKTGDDELPIPSLRHVSLHPQPALLFRTSENQFVRIVNEQNIIYQ